MTTTIEHPITDFEAVADDLYRDIHKGIRAELFAVTTSAGQLDPSDDEGRRALEAHVRSVVQLLVEHAENEDAAIQPVLERELPNLADQVAREHAAIENRMLELCALAAAAVAADARQQRTQVHRLYRELAAFTSAYLAHQDVEERVIMPALESVIGVSGCVALHHQIVGAISPDVMVRSLAIMLPAMNIDDRAELLGGMQVGAPPEVFNGVLSLASSVLGASDHRALVARLGV
jgi:hypothetical protein